MDLAESVDDLICTFDGFGDTTMDTLAMFIFGWILAALFILWLGKLLYNKYVIKNEQKIKIDTIIKIDDKKTSDVIDGTTNVQSSTTVNKLSAVKSVNSGATVTVKSGGKCGGYVPPTPPVRKRITRQSPGPDLNKKFKYVPAPQCTGPDKISVLWVNDFFQWLYNDLEIVNELVNVWIGCLNDYARKASNDQGINVEFVRILPETNPPNLSNLFCECDNRDDVTLTCDVESYPAFQLKCTRQKGDKVDTSHYRVNVNKFRARLNVVCVTEKLQANLKFDGWPEIKVAIAPVGNIKNNLDETQLQDLITEIVINSFRSTEVHFNLAQYQGCPRLVRHVGSPGQMLPLHYDSMSNAYTSTPNHYGNDLIQGNKRLLVKVIRATQLGTTRGCKQPYCVVEMDEPPQKNQTSIKKDTDSPIWDEHFLFDMSPNTAELLFEIYDHSTKPQQFLGLGIVGVEELLINPSQRQIISLQCRPYESDPISGTLTVEFLFIEGADIPNLGGSQPYKIKESIRSVSPNRAHLTTTKTTIYNDRLTNGDHFTSTALRNIPNNQLLNPNKSTLVIHSVQRQPSQRLVKVELSDGTWKEIERVEKHVNDHLNDFIQREREFAFEELPKTNDTKPSGVIVVDVKTDMPTTNGDDNITTKDVTDSIIINQEQSPNTNEAINNQTNGNAIPKDEKLGDFSNTGTLQSQGDFEYRGRPRKRRDFFGTIKRRLGKSKTRSKSAGPENDMGRDDSMNRSISADRARGVDGYRLNIPREETSRRSSLSEASGLSSASTRTYLNEASTLVLETIENGIKKHYLVPLSLAQKSRWKKKGTKLHIFNDHTFIAKHLTGGTVCQVCSKSIARRIGKQGYECRDCLLKCHKHCHVKVNDNCPTSTIHNIELSYITNPYTDKNIRML